MAKFTFPMDDDAILQLLKNIYGGDIDEYDLPEDVYTKIADTLKSGLLEGFGGDINALGDRDLELMDELTENIYHFSAAKTFQQVRDMTDALMDGDGKLRSWSDFKEIAGQIFDQYNETMTRYEAGGDMYLSTFLKLLHGLEVSAEEFFKDVK